MRAPTIRKAVCCVAAVLLVSLTMGCGTEPTGIPGGVTVTISVTTLEGPSFSLDSEFNPIIRCEVALEATAGGTGSGTWRDATAYFLFGLDRTVPADSVVLPGDDIRSSWASSDIGVGESQAATWIVEAGVPFGMRMAFRYGAPTGGAVATASVDFTCGPEIPRNPAPPEVTSLVVAPLAEPIEPGDAIPLEFQASSRLGLWQTVAYLSGPCDVGAVFAESLAETATHAVALTLPPECALGVPLTVGVVAVDAALQVHDRRSPTPIVLTDVTPPVVETLLFFPPFGAATAALQGTYFAGDSVEMLIHGSDNHQLRWFVWEVLPSGFRDSVAVAGAQVGRHIKLQLRQEWSGPIQVRVTGHDASTLTSAAVTSPPGTVTIHPTTDRPTVTATVPGEIRDVLIDAPRETLYLLQPNQSRLALFSMSTLAVTRTIDLPGLAAAFDLTPSGDSLLISLTAARALGVIDLRAAVPQLELVPLTTLDSTLGQVPGNMRVTANGKVFIQLGGSSAAALELLEKDLTTGVEARRMDAGNAGLTGGAMGRSYDHTTLVLNGGADLFQRYDAATNMFGTRRSATILDATPLLDAAGEVVAIGLDIFDASLAYVRRVASPIPPLGVPSAAAVSPDGVYLYHYAPPQSIVRSRVDGGGLTDRIPTTLDPSLFRISADGSLLVVVESFFAATSRISLVDLQ